MTPVDIRRQVVLDEHDLAADGSVAVVARRIIRGDRYRTHLLAVDLDLASGGGTVGGGHRRAIARPRQLTDGHVRDGWPRISPDGRYVAFIRDLSDDARAIPRLCLVPLAGGPVRQVATAGHGSVSEVAWSSDGDRLAFTATVDPPRFLVGHVSPAGRHPRLTDADTSPVARRITRVDWRWDGSGHVDRWSHLFVVDAAAGAVPRQVTSGDWGVSDIAWSPDGRTVAFTSARGEDADLHPRTTIWAVDVDGQGAEPREVLAPAGWANHPAWSPDGRWVVAIGVDEPRQLDDVSPELIVGPADGSAPPRRLAPDLDRPIGQWADTDLSGWMVSARGGPAWPMADRIVATVTDRGRARPTAFDLSPGPAGPVVIRTLVEGDIVAHSLCVATRGPAAGSMSWVGTVGARAMELHTAVDEGAVTGRPPSNARTAIGSAWQRRHPMPVMTLAQAPGGGGPIETWIASPPDAPEGPLPTVVDVHGGPLGAWAPAPHIEVILLVAAGYRVILPNIRGSASYGRDWIRPQLGEWGGVDAADVHSAIDHVVGMGLVDTARLGVLGLSYGGFMVNWLVGTSDRFTAAVSENGVTNQVSDWANSDSGPEYDRASLLGDPFSAEGIEKLWRQSPLRHVTNVRTPLLMLQAEADLRCPPQDNEQFFIALRHLRRTVEYVLYPNESHTYGNMGRPDRRIDRQTRMLAWFDRYLRA